MDTKPKDKCAVFGIYSNDDVFKSIYYGLYTLQHRGQESVLDVIKKYSGGQTMGVNVKLYQKIAQQWFGPVGWLIALWARILIFGTGLMALFRFGNGCKRIENNSDL